MTIATDQIIREIDLRVDQLLQAKFLILGDSAATQPLHPSAKLKLIRPRTPRASSALDQPPAARRRQISPAGRRRMQLAQRRRWKKFHAAQKAAKRAEKVA